MVVCGSLRLLGCQTEALEKCRSGGSTCFRGSGAGILRTLPPCVESRVECRNIPGFGKRLQAELARSTPSNIRIRPGPILTVLELLLEWCNMQVCWHLKTVDSQFSSEADCPEQPSFHCTIRHVIQEVPCLLISTCSRTSGSIQLLQIVRVKLVSISLRRDVAGFQGHVRRPNGISGRWVLFLTKFPHHLAGFD